MNHGKVARDADSMMSEADATAAQFASPCMMRMREGSGISRKGRYTNTPSTTPFGWSAISRHCQQSLYIPGVIVRKIG